MLLYIDPRSGSDKFLELFEGECEEMLLQGGDIAFWGLGPDDTEWLVGIEHKQVSDVLNCIKDGRFSGTQLPEMQKLYDVSFLLVEGNYQPDYENLNERNEPRLWIPFGRGRGIRFGMTYRAFDNFLNSLNIFSALCGKPCIVKRSKDKKESVEIIRDLYDYFQQPWDKHRSMRAHDRTKMERVNSQICLIEPRPGEPGYPKHLLKKAVFQIDGIGWDVAGRVADTFGTVENLLAAGQKEWEAIDGIGKVRAKQAYESLHGHIDPNIKIRKRKGDNEV